MADPRPHGHAPVLTLLRNLLFLWVRYRAYSASVDATAETARPRCYVLETRSLADLLVLEQACREQGRPTPLAPLQLGPRTEPHRVIYLQRQRGLFGVPADRPPARLEQLLAACAEHPGQGPDLIPVSVFWGQAPRRERTWFKALFASGWRGSGLLRKGLGILLHGRQVRVQFGAPVPLNVLLRKAALRQEPPARVARKTVRLLRRRFRAARTMLLGPDLSHRRTLVRALLQTRTVRDAIAQHAHAQGVPLAKAEARALRYANEIASDLSYPVIRLMDHLLGWLWHRLYHGIQVRGLARLRPYAASHELVYVPCHRSHIDYLLLSYVLYHNGLALPHIAAGNNLNLPLLGPLLRRGGAFFMRRSFRDDPLYGAVFNEYLHTLLSRGYPIEYFVEGGRSRTGRTLPARPGMLSMTIRSFLRQPKRPLLLVPVYIGYEKVLEGNSYLGELRGQGKRRESLWDLLRTLKILSQHFGQAYLTFGEPIDLAHMLQGIEPHWRGPYPEPDPRPVWLPDAVNRLGRLITTRINQATAVNPLNLVALALLATPKQALEEDALARQTELYQRLQQALPYSPDVTLPSGDGHQWIAYSERLGMLKRLPHPQGDLLYQEGSAAALLTYYRNNVLHLFALPALLACLFQHQERLETRQLLQLGLILYPYVQQELFLPWRLGEAHRLLRQWLALFVREGLLLERHGHYARPDGGSAAHAQLERLAQALQPTLERFYITLALLLRQGSARLTAAELETQSQWLAQRLAVLHGLNAPEFFDKMLFRRFIEKLEARRLLTCDAAERLCFDQRLQAAAATAEQIFAPGIRQSIQALLPS